MSFSTDDSVDYPASIKKANELMSHTHYHLYNLPTIGLHFFTVYGPIGSSDIVLFKLTKKMTDGKSIDIYNNGKIKPDFSCINYFAEAIVPLPRLDINRIVEAISQVINFTPFSVYNMDNSLRDRLTDFEKASEVEAEKIYKTML